MYSFNDSIASSGTDTVCVLWGCEVSSMKRTAVFEVEDDLLEHQFFIRTICLSAEANEEMHVVEVQDKMLGRSHPVPIATLRPHCLPMVSFSGFELMPPVTFNLRSGQGPVFICGQHVTLEMDEEEEDIVFSKTSTPYAEYLNEDGKAFVLPLIRKIKQQITSDPTLSSEYPPCLGLPEFTRRATELALGNDCCAIVENRVLGVQTVGCTGAVRLGAELLKRWYSLSAEWRGPVYLSSPCDEHLAGVFEAVGILDVREYRYWDAELRGVSAEHMLEDLEAAPELSVIVLSAPGHCPTGADLSQKDWKLVAEVMVRRRHLPFFLMPTQGLCLGDPGQDSWPLRHCASVGMELICTQAFSHNFGLYGERVGHLLLVLRQNSTLLAVQSQAERLVRTLWSRPPVGGARVVATVLSNPAHLVEWHEGVRTAVERCMLVRERLREKLRILGTPGCWDHLTQQGGVYCCTGLNAQQVEYLSKRRHIYLLPNGCLNVSCINNLNLDYVAESINLALTSLP
ncbi:putative aspartate aminotransferase, cytoplasmic 2 isoform X1 [Anguilla anguilla]|uniref:putative aspartate aminotransferase, cytoplasmic 2 isoform X1 n=1 Tax=Anguilla anguilla TaxID=7936 RepID=UPI0015B2592B|nr:putative aspartate aminotransferase, cytoplasmic 2 isoform X1 [Anguilla anguilla]